MADSFLLTLYFELRDDLSETEQHTLNYLFSNRPDPPDHWPDYEYFRSKDGRSPLTGGSFPVGAHVAAVWHSKDFPGMFSGVHFTYPNLKHTFYGDFFHLAVWLAALSCSRGHVGSLKNMDDNEGFPDLFYVYDGKLYMSQIDEKTSIVSVDTGNPRI